MGGWTDRQTVHDIEALSSQITYYYTFLLSSLYTIKKGAVQGYKQNVVDKIAVVLEFVLKCDSEFGIYDSVFTCCSFT